MGYQGKGWGLLRSFPSLALLFTPRLPTLLSMPMSEPVGPMVRLRVVRQVAGLTIQQVCDRIAERGVTISVSGLSNIETGRRPASQQVLRAYAAVLGFDHLDLWKGPGQESPPVDSLGEQQSAEREIAAAS